jgi:hypothetical protein
VSSVESGDISICVCFSMFGDKELSSRTIGLISPVGNQLDRMVGLTYLLH